MATDLETIKKVHKLNITLHQNAAQYFHSRPMAVSECSLVLPDRSKYIFKVEYDIKDIFTIGAMTHNSILMTGGTDLGKTMLARLAMNALFGKEDEFWHRLDIATDFGKDTYADVDFGTIKEGKKLSEGLYKLSQHFTLPGLILDEINRAHPSLINVLLHVFDRDVSLPDGTRAKIGYPLGNDKTYQFQVTAINEGADYTGAFNLDRALRRRTVIEIPMDIFSPTQYDKLLIQKFGDKDVELKNDINHLEDILSIYQGTIQEIPVHPVAELFLGFLGSFDLCKYSFTGEKGGVASSNGSIRQVCTQPTRVKGKKIEGADMQCEILKMFEYELCPSVRGLTPGITQKLVSVAKGFALLRATKFIDMMAGFLSNVYEQPLSFRVKDPELMTDVLQKYTDTKFEGQDLARAAISRYVTNLEVEVSDIQSAIGFVGFSKMGISPMWVLKNFQGNMFEAIGFYMQQATMKFRDGLSMPELADLDQIAGGEMPKERVDAIRRYCESENPWLWRALSPYLEQHKDFDDSKLENLYK